MYNFETASQHEALPSTLEARRRLASAEVSEGLGTVTLQGETVADMLQHVEAYKRRAEEIMRTARMRWEETRDNRFAVTEERAALFVEVCRDLPNLLKKYEGLEAGGGELAEKIKEIIQTLFKIGEPATADVS